MLNLLTILLTYYWTVDFYAFRNFFFGILSISKYHKYFINLTEFTKYPVYKIIFCRASALYYTDIY